MAIQRISTYNKLHRISKRRIQQSAQRLSQFHTNLLRREAQHGGQRDDGKEVQNEHDGGVPARGAGDDANGHEDQQDVDVVAQQRDLGDVEGRGGPPHPLVLAVHAGRGLAAEEELGDAAAVSVAAVAVARTAIEGCGFAGRGRHVGSGEGRHLCIPCAPELLAVRR